MDRKQQIGDMMKEAQQRGRAAEKVKGLAALSLAIREYPDNLVAFLWLARCACPSEIRLRRVASPASAGDHS